MRLNTISISSSHDGRAQFHIEVFSALYAKHRLLLATHVHMHAQFLQAKA